MKYKFDSSSFLERKDSALLEMEAPTEMSTGSEKKETLRRITKYYDF